MFSLVSTTCFRYSMSGHSLDVHPGNCDYVLLAFVIRFPLHWMLYKYIVYLVSPHMHTHTYIYIFIYVYIYIYINTWFPITFRKKSHRWHPSDSEVHRPWRFVALGHQADDPRATGKEPIWVEATPWAFGVAAPGFESVTFLDVHIEKT